MAIDMFHNLSAQRIFTLCVEIALLLGLIVPACAHFFLPRLPESAEHEKIELERSADELQQLLETSTTLAVQSALQAAGNYIVQALELLYTKQQIDALSKDEAQWLAGEVLSSQKFGPTGYISAVTANGVIAVHPDTNLVGKNLAEDENISRFIATHQGFIEYNLQPSPQFQDDTSQLAYISYFEPWNWIIVISIPKQDRYSLLDSTYVERQIGYLSTKDNRQRFILYPNGRLWLSPQEKSESADGSGEELPTLIELLQKQKTGFHTYNWLSRNSREYITKGLAFRENPCCNIIVGVSGQLPHTPQWLGLLNHSWIYFTVGVGFFLIFIFLFFRKALILPLHRFIDHTEHAVADLSLLPVNQTKIRECKDLASRINNLITSCIQLNGELQQEEQTSAAIHDQLRTEIVNRKETQHKLLSEIASRKSAENYLLLFKNIFDYANEGIIITDAEQHILAVNQAFSDITGYKPYEAINNRPVMLKSGQHSKEFYEEMWLALRTTGNWSGEICNRKKDGVTYTQWLSISAIKDAADTVTHYCAFFHDITELKNKEQQISFMAYRDALTKLPNRAALETRLTQAISRAKRDKTTVAVFLSIWIILKYQ